MMNGYYRKANDDGFMDYLRRFATPETRRVDWGNPLEVNQYMFALIDGGGWKMIERRADKKYRVSGENKTTNEKISGMVVDSIEDAMSAIESIEKKGN